MKAYLYDACPVVPRHSWFSCKQMQGFNISGLQLLVLEEKVVMQGAVVMQVLLLKRVHVAVTRFSHMQGQPNSAAAAVGV